MLTLMLKAMLTAKLTVSTFLSMTYGTQSAFLDHRRGSLPQAYLKLTARRACSACIAPWLCQQAHIKRMIAGESYIVSIGKQECRGS